MNINMNRSSRIEYIDAVKGIAIVLVVIGHMLRGFSSSGIYLNEKIFKYIDYTIYSFHMPLFFIVSGMLYTYKNKIYDKKDYINFIKLKSKNILVPYFIFSWIQILIKIIMSGSVNKEVKISSLYTIVYKPVEQFWFLYTLFIIFMIVGLLDYKIKNEKLNLYYLLLAIF